MYLTQANDSLNAKVHVHEDRIVIRLDGASHYPHVSVYLHRSEAADLCAALRDRIADLDTAR